MREETPKVSLNSNESSFTMKRFGNNSAFAVAASIFRQLQTIRWFLFSCLIVFTASQAGQSQTVMPNFAVVGQKGESLGKLWNTNRDDHIFPKQVAVDFNDRGIIYGFVCEYWWDQDVFMEIKGILEKRTGAQQKSRSERYFAWRDEDQKLVISLFHDRESNTIKLIAVSIDAAIRGKSDKGNESTK